MITYTYKVSEANSFYQFDDEREYIFRLFLENTLPKFVDKSACQVEDVRRDVVRASSGDDR